MVRAYWLNRESRIVIKYYKGYFDFFRYSAGYVNDRDSLLLYTEIYDSDKKKFIDYNKDIIRNRVYEKGKKEIKKEKIKEKIKKMLNL